MAKGTEERTSERSCRTKQHVCAPDNRGNNGPAETCVVKNFGFEVFEVADFPRARETPNPPEAGCSCGMLKPEKKARPISGGFPVLGMVRVIFYTAESIPTGVHIPTTWTNHTGCSKFQVWFPNPRASHSVPLDAPSVKCKMCSLWLTLVGFHLLGSIARL